MLKSCYFVVDVETGGLDPAVAPITQLAVEVLDPWTGESVDRLTTYVRPYGGLTIDPQAISGTLVRMSDLTAAPDIGTVMASLITLIREHWGGTPGHPVGRPVLVGHNVAFDRGFIARAFAEVGENIDTYFQPCPIDTMALGKMMRGVDASVAGKTNRIHLNLTETCSSVGIELSSAHDAGADAAATAALFRTMMNRLRTAEQKEEAKDKTSTGRKRGNDFFEFTCAAK